MAKSRTPYQLPKPLLCEAQDAERITMELIDKYIRKHENRLQRYKYLEALYDGFHDIYRQPDKEKWKPDNRLAVNFPRYITDTFMGYAYGLPIKKTCDDDKVMDAVTAFDAANDIVDHEYELFRKACIYGHSWEYIYQDEELQTKMTVCSPIELFAVYDDTVKGRALFCVRYGYHWTDSEFRGEKYGEVLTKTERILFDGEKITERLDNPYGLIPCVECRLNDERMGLFESISGLVEEYNHIVGEKANDVDAFAEAYLAIMGAEVDEEDIQKIRDNRVINFYKSIYGEEGKDPSVQFLQKPTADGTQENLLDRLERLIYQISMVANISDESYGTAASGVSLAYKMQAMSNLAAGFDRKNTKTLQKRYKIFCSLGTNVSDPDAYLGIKFTMGRNVPKNLLEEAQTATQLEGVVSKETQLKILSIVDNVKDEIERLNEEQQQAMRDAVMMEMFTNQTSEGVKNETI